jgi:Mn-containing catalase
MFLHRKELIQPISVGKPDARFGTFLLEQFGGATGELTAALQYWVQSCHVEDAGIRDMLQDIAIEEFSHLEMVGKLIAQHTSKMDQTSVHDAPLFKLKGGGPHFLDSQGSCWTAAYVNEGGNVVRDLRANIASEAGARQTYEALIKACDDDGTKKTLVHLAPDFEYVAKPAPMGGFPAAPINSDDERPVSTKAKAKPRQG